MTEGASSPTPDHPIAAERLHQQIRLITAPTWLLTVVLLGLMAGAVLWAVYGTVLIQVSGRGLLLPAESRQIPVFAVEEGQLVKTLVSPGDAVKAGQTLFELDQPALDLQVKLAKQRLTGLRNVLKMVTDNADKVLAEQQRVTGDQIAALDQQNAQLKDLVDLFSKRVAELEGLLQAGKTTEAELEAARQSLDSATLELLRSQAQRAAFHSDLLRTTVSWEREKMSAQIAVEEQQGVVTGLEERLAQATRITAATDGIVSEILVSAGQWIADGTRLAVIGTRAPGYEVLAFFSPLDGQRVQDGMAVDIVPSTVKREEYGMMEGVVSEVSSRPISLEEAAVLLGNDTLARYLTGEKPPIFARIKVSTMPGDPERFVWRSGSGPPFSVTAGTVTDAEVTVQEQTPISLVLPYLKMPLGS